MSRSELAFCGLALHELDCVTHVGGQVCMCAEVALFQLLVEVRLEKSFP